MKTQAYFNTGDGGSIQPIDIGHRDYACLVSADTAFWALVRKDKLASALAGSHLLGQFLFYYLSLSLVL